MSDILDGEVKDSWRAASVMSPFGMKESKVQIRRRLFASFSMFWFQGVFTVSLFTSCSEFVSRAAADKKPEIRAEWLQLRWDDNMSGVVLVSRSAAPKWPKRSTDIMSTPMCSVLFISCSNVSHPCRVMNTYEEYDDEELSDYIIQLSIQESCQDAFLKSAAR